MSSSFPLVLPHFEVLISDETSVHIESTRLPVADGVSLHEATLDALQEQARQLGCPVDATISDTLNGYLTRIRVAPDGSSRLLEEPQDLSPDQFPEIRATETRATETRAMEIRAAETEHPDAEPSAPSDAEDAGPALVAQTAAVPVPVPPAAAPAVAEITALLEAGDVERAGVVASTLHHDLAHRRGSTDPATLEARALQSFIAYLGGEFERAVTVSVEVAMARQAQGDVRARLEARRAVAAWQHIEDHALAHRLGRELALLWSGLAATGAWEDGDRQAVELVEHRLRTHGPAPAALPGVPGEPAALTRMAS